MDFKKHIKETPDFPKKGILFRDFAPLLRDHFQTSIHALAELYTQEQWSQVDCVAGVDSRGFILAAGLAFYKQKNFIPVRKSGKLPPPVQKVKYDLEYGEDALEMSPGKGSVLLIDDVLATGGTLKAALELCEKSGFKVVDIGCFINLSYLNNLTWNSRPIKAVIEYEK